MAAHEKRTPKLGASLAVSLPLLTDLILEETDRTRRKELRALHRELSGKLRKLVEGNVSRATKEYEQASKALARANVALRAAKKDLAKVASSIEKLAKAADLIGKVADMAS